MARQPSFSDDNASSPRGAPAFDYASWPRVADADEVETLALDAGRPARPRASPFGLSPRGAPAASAASLRMARGSMPEDDASAAAAGGGRDGTLGVDLDDYSLDSRMALRRQSEQGGAAARRRSDEAGATGAPAAMASTRTSPAKQASPSKKGDARVAALKRGDSRVAFGVLIKPGAYGAQAADADGAPPAPPEPMAAEIAAQAFEPTAEASAALESDAPLAAGEWLELEADEPTLSSKADFEKWRDWARDAGAKFRAASHPHRVDEASGEPVPLPLCGSGPLELGASLGVGIRLYFEWLKLLCALCALGLLVRGPSLGYALYAIWNPALGGYAPASLVGPASVLALTTIGQRIGCGSNFCRLLTVVEAALELIYTPLLLAAAARFASLAQTAASLTAVLSVRISSYTVELHGLPSEATPSYIAQRVTTTLAAQAEARAAECRRQARRAWTFGGRVRLEQEARFLEQLLAPASFAFFVHDVVPVSANGGLLRAALRKAPLEKAVLTYATRAHRQLLAGRRYESMQTLRALRRKQRTLLGLRARLAARAALRGGVSLQSAFVTFEQIEGAEAALQCWQRGWSPSGLARWLLQDSGWPCACARGDALDLRMQPPPPSHQRTSAAMAAAGPGAAAVAVSPAVPQFPSRLVATVAPEPSELVWENLSARFGLERQLRLALSLLVILVATVASLVVIVFANSAGQASGAVGGESGAACAALAGCDAGAATDGARYGLQYGAIVVVVGINALLKRLLGWVVREQRHGSKGAEVVAKARLLALSQFVNTALLAIAVASALPDRLLTADALEAGPASSYSSHFCWAPPAECAAGGARAGSLLPCCAFGPSGLLLRGQVLSLDRGWFVLLGGGMLLTLTLQLLVLIATPAAAYAYAKARERLLLPRALTSEAVRELLTGPAFDLAAQYGQALSFAAVILVFGPAMPYLYVLGLVGFPTLYWTDKLLLLRVCSLPPAYDERLSLALVPALNLIAVGHIAVAFATCMSLESVNAALFRAQFGEALQPAYSGLGGLGDLRGLLVDQRAPYGIGIILQRPETAALAACAALVLLCAVMPAQVLRRLGGAEGTDVRSVALRRASLMRTVRVSPFGEDDDDALDAVAALPERRPNQSGRSEGTPTLPQALAGVAHPTVRTLRRPGRPRPDGREPESESIIVGASDLVHAKRPAWRRALDAVDPSHALFALAGLSIQRPHVSAAEYSRATPIRVHLVNDGARSYSPALHAFYRNAFLGGNDGIALKTLAEEQGRDAPALSGSLFLPTSGRRASAHSAGGGSADSGAN